MLLEAHRCLPKVCACIFALLLAFSSWSQESTIESWTGIGLRQDLSKRWRVDAGLQLRLENRPEPFKSSFAEFGLLYKFNKYFRLAAEYRFTITDEYVRNRLTGAAYLRYNAKPFKLVYRLKYEVRMRRFESVTHLIRNKLTVNYRFNKRYTIYGTGELFYRKNFEMGNFDTYRIGCGLSYNPKKRHELDFFYRYEQMFNLEAPDLAHIVGVKYTTTLKKRKKKKSDQLEDEDE